MPRFELRELPITLRVLCAGFLISLGLAYAVALLFVFVQSGMTTKGISEQYRGGAGTSEAAGTSDEEDSIPGLSGEWKSRDQGMKFPKPLKEMILTTHLHLLSISGILFMVGAIFACSSFPERAKPWIIGAGFAGLALDYACMWGVRYVGGGFSAGVYLFGFLQSLSLTAQMLASLKDLLLPRLKGI